MDSTDSGTFNFEDLSIDDGLLCLAWRVLVEGSRQLRIHADEIRDTTGMVAVPMSQEHVRQRKLASKQSLSDEISPVGNSLAGVDDESMGSSTYNVRVGALEGELSYGGGWLVLHAYNIIRKEKEDWVLPFLDSGQEPESLEG